MPIIAIPVRWIESMKPASRVGGGEIKIIAAMKPEQMLEMMIDMSRSMSEIAWAQMVAKTMSEGEQ